MVVRDQTLEFRLTLLLLCLLLAVSLVEEEVLHYLHRDMVDRHFLDRRRERLYHILNLHFCLHHHHHLLQAMNFPEVEVAFCLHHRSQFHHLLCQSQLLHQFRRSQFSLRQFHQKRLLHLFLQSQLFLLLLHQSHFFHLLYRSQPLRRLYQNRVPFYLQSLRLKVEVQLFCLLVEVVAVEVHHTVPYFLLLLKATVIYLLYRRPQRPCFLHQESLHFRHPLMEEGHFLLEEERKLNQRTYRRQLPI